MRYHWSCEDGAFAGHFDDARRRMPSGNQLSDSRHSTSITDCRPNQGGTPLRKGCRSSPGVTRFLTDCCRAQGASFCAFSNPKWNCKTPRRRDAGYPRTVQEVHQWYGEYVGRTLRHRCRAKNRTCGCHRICRRGCHRNCTWSNRHFAPEAAPQTDPLASMRPGGNQPFTAPDVMPSPN